jgi:AcrR family transcriptional regulator
MTATLTPKGEQTRKLILETALQLFTAQGYEATTMRDIATAADCSLGLTYRYFARKEDLVMALYYRYAEQFAAQVERFAPAPIAEQFERAMLAKLELVAPYKEAMSALFGAAMNPRSGIAVLGETTADIRVSVRGVYERLIEQATDAPREQQIRQLATVLYGAHLAVLLFWFYDRTPDSRATREVIALARDVLSMVRPILRLPPVAKALARLARAAGAMIGTENAA